MGGRENFCLTTGGGGTDQSGVCFRPVMMDPTDDIKVMRLENNKNSQSTALIQNHCLTLSLVWRILIINKSADQREIAYIFELLTRGSK